MARLIDADALKTEARKLENIGDNDFERGFCWGVDEVVNLIESAPTVDAEPVRHGRWETWGYVFHGIEWKRCSRCGKCADVSYYGLLDGEIKMSTPAICGGCGADMREGGAENG